MPFRLFLYSKLQERVKLIKLRTHYYIGKCLWKMFSCEDSMRTTSKRVEMHDVLNAFRKAISALPKRKDSRADPIFEPHFKLVSIVHKLVVRGAITVSSVSDMQPQLLTQVLTSL